MAEEEVNFHGTTEEADDSGVCVDVHIPVSMDETNPVVGNPLCSVSYLDPRLGSSSLSVPIPCLYAPQGSPGCDAGHGVSYVCDMSEAPKVKLGVGRGIAAGPVETPLKNNQCVSNSCGPLPALTHDTDGVLVDASRSEDELELLELEVRLKRLKLERRKRVADNDRPRLHWQQPTTEPLSTDVDHQQHKVVDILGQLVQNLTLPKFEIAPFSGAPTEFHRFMMAFDTHIGSQVSDPTRRLSYLINYCKGPAKRAVAHCSLLPANQGYPEAVRILYDRFGKPHDVVKAATTELFAGPRVSVGDTAGLTELVTQMRECSVTLGQFNQQDQLNCFLYLVKVVERLPRPMQERWAEVAESITSCGRQPTFGDLLGFVEKRIAVATSPYGQVVGEATQVARRNLTTGYPGRTGNINLSATGNRSQLTSICRVCSQGHYMLDCPDFLAQTPMQRLSTARKHKLCFVCLQANHMVKSCRSRIRCNADGCNRRHHKLLHFNEDTDLTSANSTCGGGSSKGHVVLGCIPVRLVGPKGRLDTYAFIDNGSDTSLLSRDVVNRLGLNVNTCRLDVRTLHGSRSVSSGCAKVQLQSIYDGSVIEIDKAYVVARLPINYVDAFSANQLAKWSHLAETNEISIPDKTVGMLIGCDVPEVHEVLEQRMSVGKQPYAVKTILGWVLRGPSGVRGVDMKRVNFVGAEEDSLVERLAKYYK